MTTATPALPSITDVPDLLDDWAADVITSNGEGLGYSSRSALVGFTEPNGGQRPGSTVPRGAVDGYGTSERRLLVAVGRGIKRLSVEAQMRIQLRYLEKPRLNRKQEADFFEVSESSVKRAWREIRGGLLSEIINDLVKEG